MTLGVVVVVDVYSCRTLRGCVLSLADVKVVENMSLGWIFQVDVHTSCIIPSSCTARTTSAIRIVEHRYRSTDQPASAKNPFPERIDQPAQQHIP
jgi:hypothetical protein